MKFVVLFAILIVTAAASPQLIPSTSLSSGSTSFVSVVNDAIKSAADILTEASKSVNLFQFLEDQLAAFLVVSYHS